MDIVSATVEQTKKLDAIARELQLMNDLKAIEIKSNTTWSLELAKATAKGLKRVYKRAGRELP